MRGSARSSRPLTAEAGALMEQHNYQVDFDRFEASLNGRTELPLHKMRRSALGSFLESGFPRPHDEAWRYTNLASIANTRFALAPKTALAPEALAGRPIPGIEHRLVFVNGHYAPELSSAALPKGVTVRSIAEVTAERGSPDFAVLEEHLGRHAQVEQAFTALNTAFLHDGAFLHVGRNTQCGAPLELLYLSSGEPGTVSYPRLLVVMDEGAELTVVESFAGLNDANYLTAHVAELVLAPGSRLTHLRVQRESEQAYHASAIYAAQQRDSYLSTAVVTFGGALVRNEILPVLDGEGIECLMHGLTLANGTQHIDNTTVIDHAKPNCQSTEVFKGIFGGRSNGVFSGTIIVRPDAQKTNAIQSNDNILLSEQAVVNTRPQLKIWADDVKCTHGATVGQLDESGLFYLRSRGIGKQTARAMLIRAFAEAVLARLQPEAAAHYLEEQLHHRLGELLGDEAAN